MKNKIIYLSLMVSLLAQLVFAQNYDYTNIVRQVQLNSRVVYDVTVAQSSDAEGLLSPLEIVEGGARFELWTIKNDPLQRYLLTHTTVGTYIPTADVWITSEDPNKYNAVPRTRVGRPYLVTIQVNGLRSLETDPEASRKVRVLRHTQSYGVDGIGADINPQQATLMSQVLVSKGDLDVESYKKFYYSKSSIPSADFSANLAKTRGEERFSVWTLDDYQMPSHLLGTQTIKIWPEAEGSIDGVVVGQRVRYKFPQLTLTVKDVYPGATVYAHAYKGNARPIEEGLNENARVLLGSEKTLDPGVPWKDVLVLDNYAGAFGDDGIWTIELIESSVFGSARLDYVEFELDRTMKMNGTFTTAE